MATVRCPYAANSYWSSFAAQRSALGRNTYQVAHGCIATDSTVALRRLLGVGLAFFSYTYVANPHDPALVGTDAYGHTYRGELTSILVISAAEILVAGAIVRPWSYRASWGRAFIAVGWYSRRGFCCGDARPPRRADDAHPLAVARLLLGRPRHSRSGRRCRVVALEGSLLSACALTCVGVRLRAVILVPFA
jgi:hypothetical protein